jgi:hypothetical protein
MRVGRRRSVADSVVMTPLQPWVRFPHFYPRHMYLASALCIAQATLAAALIAFT